MLLTQTSKKSVLKINVKFCRDRNHVKKVVVKTSGMTPSKKKLWFITKKNNILPDFRQIYSKAHRIILWTNQMQF